MVISLKNFLDMAAERMRATLLAGPVLTCRYPGVNETPNFRRYPRLAGTLPSWRLGYSPTGGIPLQGTLEAAVGIISTSRGSTSAPLPLLCGGILEPGNGLCCDAYT